MLPRLSQILTAVAVALLGACSGSSGDATGGPTPAVSPADSPDQAAVPDPAAATSPPAARAEEDEAAVPNEGPPTPARAEQLELTFVGDVIFGRYRGPIFDPIPEDGHDPFAAMRDAMRSDLLVGNLETPLVRALPERSPIGSRFAFGASPEHAKLLVDAGFAAVSLANNHSFDQREAGLRETPEILEELGIVPLGRSRDDEPLFVVDTVERKGWRVGFVAATTRRNAPQREGMPQLPFADTRDLDDELIPVVQKARREHDLVAVIVHWGDEYADEPAFVQRRAARALVDAGADLVIGHHPHVLQGFEVYGRGLIAYSLGNFVFENTNDPPRLTGVLRVRASGTDRCLDRVVFHPAYVKRMPIQHPVPATGFMGRKVTERVTTLSKRMGVQWAPEGDDLVVQTPPCDAGDRTPPADPKAP